MSKYNLISVLALLALVLILPFYMIKESVRLEEAQLALRERFIADGTVLYLENCADCHGIKGEGTGINPALNKIGMAKADPDLLTRTIARATHGSPMAAWHISEGGTLDDYQIEKLVTLIQFADWEDVAQIAEENGDLPTKISTMELEESYLAGLEAGDPHQCTSCHEEPEVHKERFGLDCVRCHSLTAWLPASLTRHVFHIDHGGKGTVACETCHNSSYVDITCYGCHDHTPEQMVTAHERENIFDITNCIHCHPTGEPGEAQEKMNNTLASK